MSELITKYDPKSLISEVFRLLRTKHSIYNKDENQQQIMLTSTNTSKRENIRNNSQLSYHVSSSNV